MNITTLPGQIFVCMLFSSLWKIVRSGYVYFQIDEERSSSSSTNPLAVNLLNSKIDLHLISPYSITPE